MGKKRSRFCVVFFRPTSDVNNSKTVYPIYLKIKVQRVPTSHSSYINFQVNRINHFRDIDVGSWPKKNRPKKRDLFCPPLEFIYFIKEVFFIRCHHAHFLGRTRTRARALPQPLPAGRIMVILQYNIAYCIIKGEREKTRATCHYSTASWPVAHQSFCCVTSSACTR